MAPQNRFFASILLLALTVFPMLVSSQGILASGNSQLPTCGQQCMLLNQAAQACGGTTAATLTVWNCFCQSGYLKPLYQSSNGICTDTCTSTSENQDVMNWYKSNCGTDNGASEHSNTAAPAASGAATTTATTTTSATPTPSSSNAPTNAGSSNTSTSSASNVKKPWIDTHYRWIIFIVVVVIGFALVILLAWWLKRRHARKQDQISGGFNAGVSEQGPPMTSVAFNNSGTLTGPGSRSSSPARTREAFMPYGYNYAHSVTRLNSPAQMPDSLPRSPLARGSIPVSDAESDKEITATAPKPAIPPKNQRRVLVRERPT